MPPNGYYECLGSVGIRGRAKPELSNYRCVHACFTQLVSPGQWIWSDRWTGADEDVALYKLPTSGSFFASYRYELPVRGVDLKEDLICEIR